MTEPVSGARSAVDDAADLDVVIEARRLRRRLRKFGRVVKVLFVVGFFAMCGGAVALPSMMTGTWKCRSQQSEAKGNLKALYVSNESYRAEYDVYDGDFNRLGFEPKGSKLRYAYVVTDVVNEPDRARWRGWAFRVDGERDDLWTISEKNDLDNVVNGCER